MTPKEKAEELIQKTAISTSWGTNYTGGDDIPIYKNQYAKQCALLAVDEILSIINRDMNYQNVYAYFLEVKQEIEKL